MHNALIAALITLGSLTLCHASARAHGGPPATYDVLLGADQVSLVTSHGFFAEDTGWAWICEEATDADVAASVLRTPQRWFVGTLYGLKTSLDGCEWSDDPGLLDTYILRVMQDRHDPERVWAVTMTGLWVVDGLADARLERTIDFSVRHAGQADDGALLLVGFDGPEPIAQLGDQRIPLPAETGRIEVVNSDPAGRFYVRFPAGQTDRLVRVSEEGAEVLLEQTSLIRDVASLGSDLYVLYSEGVSWSQDDGQTWSTPAGAPITCLRGGASGFYACPPPGATAALYYAPALEADPVSWPWESALDFVAVAPNACAAGSTVRNICPLIWQTVAEELGIVIESNVTDPAETAPPTSGCAAHRASEGRVASLLLWMLLSALMLSRRRSFSDD
jgi:hypothetical protein